MAEPLMRIHSWHKIENETHVLQIEFPRMLLEDAPDLRRFWGAFNVDCLMFSSPTGLERVTDWVQLEPERLSMQLLRYAYLAALAEEGHYGREDL